MRLWIPLTAAFLLAAATVGSAQPAGPGAPPEPVVECRDGGAGTAPAARRDARLGPLAIMLARRTPRDRRGAFDGHGWKLPALLAKGETVTLSVPRRLRGRIGFVYTLRTQARVARRGPEGADSSVTFVACAGEDAPARTGWPGGIVVDRRRCVRLTAVVDGAPKPIERRVPLGRRC
jgi:hypothetical protein